MLAAASRLYLRLSNAQLLADTRYLEGMSHRTRQLARLTYSSSEICSSAAALTYMEFAYHSMTFRAREAGVWFDDKLTDTVLHLSMHLAHHLQAVAARY